jgi:heme/copper-type cytochrome/quinol oxidase subunit 2
VKRAVLLLALLAAPVDAVDRLEVTVSKSGFRPARLTLRRGETARLAITSADGEHCFAVDAFRVEKRIVRGRTTVVDLVPDRAGTFSYHDCLAPEGESQSGQLVVTE